jgi:hypothetical protein
LRRVSLTPEVTTKIETITAETATDALRMMHVPGTGSHQGQLVVDLQRVELNGAYWLPLYKWGRCDFAASYKLRAEDAGSSVTMDGQVQGHIDFTVTGVCSSYRCRQLIGQKVAQQVASEIENQILSQRVKE